MQTSISNTGGNHMSKEIMKEIMEKLKVAKSDEERKRIIESCKISLTDEELEQVSGGAHFDEDVIFDCE